MVLAFRDKPIARLCSISLPLYRLSEIQSSAQMFGGQSHYSKTPSDMINLRKVWHPWNCDYFSQRAWVALENGSSFAPQRDTVNGELVDWIGNSGLSTADGSNELTLISSTRRSASACRNTWGNVTGEGPEIDDRPGHRAFDKTKI